MLNLLLSSVMAYQFYESNFINQLNMAFEFDHNIFLFHSSVDTSELVVPTSNPVKPIPRCLFTNADDDNLNGSNISESIGTGKVELLIGCPQRATDLEDVLKFMHLVKRVQMLNVNLKIALFLSRTVSGRELHALFKWCWDQRIVNIIVAFRHPYTNTSLSVFGFSPFGTFSVINKTESVAGGGVNVEHTFPGKISNVQQHAFRIAVINDTSIIQYSRSVRFTGGPDENLWTAVLSALNGTFSMYPWRSSLDPIDILDNGTIDIHGDMTELANPRIVTIYPLVMEILSIIVPKAQPYSAFESYIKIVTTSNLVGYTFLMIGVGVLVLMCSRYMNDKNCRILDCAVDFINILLNDNLAIKYQQSSFSENCLTIPMTFAGLIIVNGFLSSLKSQLTRPVMQPQIETIEDLYHSPLPMTSPNEYWLVKDIELLNSKLKYGNFSHKIRAIKNSDFEQQIFNEVQFSFAEYNSVSKFTCKHKRYHITPIQLKWMWFGHSTRSDFPFIDRFNEIIQRLNAAGLYVKWWKDAVVEDKIYRTVSAETHTDHFATPVFIVYGWIAGCIVFVVEVNWKHIKAKLKWRRQGDTDG